MADFGYYNAAIRDEDKNIIARTYLTDPKNVPWSWQVVYKERELYSASDVEKVMSNPDQPLSITKRKVISAEGQPEGIDKGQDKTYAVCVTRDATTTIALQVKGSNTVEDLGFMIARKLGAAPKVFGMCFEGKALSRRAGSMTMEDLGVTEDKNHFHFENFEGLRDMFKSGKVIRPSALFANTSKYPLLFVTTLIDKNIPIEAEETTKTEDLKIILEEIEGTPRLQQRLVFAGRQLEDGRSIRGDYNIQDSFTIHMVLALRGGGNGGFPFGNLEGNLIIGEGTPADRGNFWRAYGKGLNLKGNCDYRKCKSRKYSKKDLVIYTTGFQSSVILTKETIYHCPACMKVAFKPSDFLISGARCEFRFKVTGENEIKSKTLASGPYPQYIELADEGDKMEYDCIKILVTKLEETPHDCIACGEDIGYFSDEANYECCGHPYHKKCAEQWKKCPLCLAKTVSETEIKNLLTIFNL